MARYDDRLDPLAAHINVKLLSDGKSGIDQSETDRPFPGLISHAALKPLSHERSYSTQSAMNMSVSCGFLAFRFEPKTSFFPSGENMGKLSKTSL